MQPVNQNSYQLQSIFGGAYVPEQHGDASRGHLVHADNCETDLASFCEIMKGLRSALSLRKAA